MTSQQARAKKKSGNAEEVKFNAYFSSETLRSELENLNFSGPSPDCYISVDNFKKLIVSKLGSMNDFSVSLKSGYTMQFHLGNIEELSTKSKVKIFKKIIKNKKVTCIEHDKSFSEQEKHLKSYSFWKKYLGKGELLCINDKKGNYKFYRMDEIINLIIQSTSWRILETGRIKGDVRINGNKCALFTFELRPNKNQFVLGAHGGKNGKKFELFLDENLKYCPISPE